MRINIIKERCSYITITFIFIMLVTMMSYCIEVKAFSPLPEESYIKEINDDYVFIMIGKDSSEPLLSSTGLEYKKPGLYSTDGSVEPIWTINFYTWDGAVYISQDGQYFVHKAFRMTGYEQYTSEIIAFYKNGERLSLYTKYDLIENFEGNPPGGRTSWTNNTIITDETVTILTIEDYKYIISTQTGEIISKEYIKSAEDGSAAAKTKPIEAATLIMLIAGAGLLGFIIFVLIRKN